MTFDYEFKYVRDYKGFEIQKAWQVDFEGKKRKGTEVYIVVDDEDDCIGEEYKTLTEAKKFIDTL